MTGLTAAQANRIAPPPLEILAAITCPTCGETVGFDAWHRFFFCNDCGIRWDTGGVDMNHEFAGQWTDGQTAQRT